VNKKKPYRKRRAKLLRERNLASQIKRKCIGLTIGDLEGRGQNWKVRAVSQETAISKLEGPGSIARDCNIKIGRSGQYCKRMQYKNALYQYYFGQCPLSDVKKKRIVFNITLLQ
jgi:hypothetical protein